MPIILQITVVPNSGSTGRIAEDIGLQAMSCGWESYIAFGRKPRQSKSRLIRVGSDVSVMMHGIRTRLFDAHGFGSKNATKRLVQKIKEIKPDIIHLHIIHGYYINIEILFDYFREANIPIVWTHHDCWAVTGHCVHFENVGCEKWKASCFSCPKKRSYPGSIFLDKSKSNFNKKKLLFTAVNNLTIVPVCNWLGKSIKKSFLSQYNTMVIYNGVDTNVFCHKEYALPIRSKIKDCFVILAVSNVWNETKGFGDLIALNKLLDHSSERLMIVGVTAKQIKRLPSEIIAIKRTENVEQLAKLYSSADVVINPTYEDTLPTVNIEAIACGTPVITYDTGGSADVLTSETGIVVPVGDIKQLFEAIRTIKEKTKKAYTHECRERALKHFKKEERFAEYIDLYNDLINRK